jgi:phosphate transport system protein
VRVELQDALDQLGAALQEEGDLVLRSLRGTLNALAARDVELADEVIAFDDEVDDRYLHIEQRAEELLATQSPTAGDLRLVLAVLHDNLHLERMADYAVTIAKLGKLAEGLPPHPPVVEALEEMGERAEQMIRVALDSLVERDLAMSERLVELDELIDRANLRVFELVLDIGREESHRQWGLLMLQIARCLERIGDHAVDIGEQTAFLVSGEFREFTDASHPGGGWAH